MRDTDKLSSYFNFRMLFIEHNSRRPTRIWKNCACIGGDRVCVCLSGLYLCVLSERVCVCV